MHVHPPPERIDAVPLLSRWRTCAVVLAACLGCGGNTQALAGGKSYFRVLSGASSGGSVTNYVGLWNASADQSTASIDALTSTTVKVLQAGSANTASVQMAPGAPDAVAWLVDASASAEGELYYADLSAATVSPAPVPIPAAATTMNATGVPVSEIYFGANGHQLLFLADDNSTQTGSPGGEPFWFNGVGVATSLAQQSGAPPVLTTSTTAAGLSPAGSVILSQDRTKAVMGINFDGQSQGDLILVDLTTGLVTTIDTGVVLLAGAYGPLYAATFSLEGEIVSSAAVASHRAYTASADCSTVVYTKLVGESGANAADQFQVFRWKEGSTTGEQLQQDSTGTGATGVFPAVSPSGDVVAYWNFSASSSLEAGQIGLHVWTAATGIDVYVAAFDTPSVSNPSGPVISLPVLPPIISPDDGLLVFLSDFVEAGIGPYGGDLGSLWMLPVQIPPAFASQAAQYTQALGTAVAYQSVLFGPPGQPELSSLLTFLGSVHDGGGTETLTGGTGSICAIDTSAWPPADLGSGAVIATGVAPGDISYLPEVNGLAFVSSVGHPSVFVPGMSLARDLESGDTGFQLTPSTFQTGAAASQPGDLVVYLDEATPATYWGKTNPLLESSVHVARIVTGGEAVHPLDTSAATEQDAFVWAGIDHAGNITGVFDGTAASATFVGAEASVAADGGTTSSSADGGTTSSSAATSTSSKTATGPSSDIVVITPP